MQNWCGKYVIDFNVNIDFSGDSASQVSEIIGSSVSFTTMRGSCIFRGAGWYMDCIFLVLIVKPKLSQALEKSDSLTVAFPF